MSIRRRYGKGWLTKQSALSADSIAERIDLRNAHFHIRQAKNRRERVVAVTCEMVRYSSWSVTQHVIGTYRREEKYLPTKFVSCVKIVVIQIVRTLRLL